MEMILWGIAGTVAFALLAGLYFLPSICAFARGHPSKVGILILNTLLGLTLLGWIVSLVWAFTDTRRA